MVEIIPLGVEQASSQTHGAVHNQLRYMCSGYKLKQGYKYSVQLLFIHFSFCFSFFSQSLSSSLSFLHRRRRTAGAAVFSGLRGPKLKLLYTNPPLFLLLNPYLNTKSLKSLPNVRIGSETGGGLFFLSSGSLCFYFLSFSFLFFWFRLFLCVCECLCWFLRLRLWFWDGVFGIDFGYSDDVVIWKNLGFERLLLAAAVFNFPSHSDFCSLLYNPRIRFRVSIVVWENWTFNGWTLIFPNWGRWQIGTELG
jgi:hypothetical protein